MGTAAIDFCSQQALGRAGVDRGVPETGCVVVGPSGSGKTTVLTALTAQIPGPVIAVSGIRRTPGMVFGHLPECRALGLADGAPARLRWAVADAIRTRSSGVLVVDDADLLDDDAAAIVHSLVVHDGVRAYVSCAASPAHPIPGAVRSLWKDGHLARLDLVPIDSAHVNDYLHHTIGYPVTMRDVESFTRWSRGRPHSLVQLVHSSLRTATWRVISGVAVLDVRPVPASDLREELESIVTALPSDVRPVVEAFGAAIPVIGGPMLDWLPLAPMIAIAGMDALVASERAGLIEADSTRVRLVEPFLADVVAARTPTLRRAHLAGELAAAIESASESGDVATTLTGLLAASSIARTSASERLAGARSALRLGDPAVARDLVSSDGDVPEDDELAVVYGWSLIHLNDIPALGRLIREREDCTSSGWAGMVEFLAEFRRRRELGTTGFLARHSAAPGGLLGVDAEWSRRDRLSGAWLGFLFAETAMLVGRFTEARALLDVVEPASDDDGLLIFHLVLVDERLTTTVVGADAACERVEKARRVSAWRSDQVCASADYVCALSHARTGRFDLALAELHNCAPFLARTRLADSPSRMIDRIDSMTARPRAPFEVDDGVDVPADPYGAMYSSEANIDAAWLLAARGDVDTAVARLLDFGEKVARTAPTLAVDQFEGAARFLTVPAGEVATRLVNGIRRVREPIEAAARVHVLVDYGTALEAGDPIALESVAARYRGIGFRPVAADAYMQAALAHRVAGDTQAALAASAQARSMASVSGLVSPSQQATATPRLTRREREVVALVAESLSNTQIAERLRLSVRTVEGHLLRASGKFGVTDRRALADCWLECR